MRLNWAASSAPSTKPARAKLLDILIQFPIPPAPKESDTGVQQAANPATSSPMPLHQLVKKELEGVEGPSADMDIVEYAGVPFFVLSTADGHSFHTSDILVPLSPVSTRRSSLVWFADKSNYCDDLSTDSANCWVLVERGPNHNTEWITDWREDMATVLEGLHEVHKQDEEEDFRDIFDNASLSSGFSLRASSGSLSGHVGGWSGKLKWNA